MIRTYRTDRRACLTEDYPGGVVKFNVPVDSGVQKIVRDRSRIIFFDTSTLEYHVEDEKGVLLDAGRKCPHLGPPIERDGVTVKVKCGCSKREQDQPHAAHQCELYGRCLPTLIPVDIDAWLARRPESEIYHLCHGCEARS